MSPHLYSFVLSRLNRKACVISRILKIENYMYTKCRILYVKPFMLKRIIAIIIVLVIALLVALFAYYNQEASTIRFMKWSISMSSAFIYI